MKLYTIGQCEVVNQDKVLGYNFYYWYVHLIIYVYFHNVCTTILLFKPLGTRVRLILKSVRQLEKDWTDKIQSVSNSIFVSQYKLE